MSYNFKARQVCPEIKLTDVQAATIGGELFRLFGADLNAVPAKSIVAAARSRASPMHEIIWGKSDKELAVAARCQLARKLVNSIRIVPPDPAERATWPIAVNLKPGAGMARGYVATDAAQASPFMMAQQEEKAFARLNAWLDEFAAFRHGTQIAPLWDGVRKLLVDAGAIDDLKARVAKVSTRQRRPKPERERVAAVG